MLPDEFGFFRKNMHKYTNETPTSKSLINNIKGFGASFQKVRKTGGADQRWDQIVGQPDPEFWADFNYLPIESELEKSLQRLVQKQ